MVAARIGPTVCELEGPIPILNSSKTLTAMLRCVQMTRGVKNRLLCGQNHRMDKLILYTRPDCHLCEQAEDLVAQVAPAVALQAIDIEDDLELVMRYGLSIPVLRQEPGGQELGWPFDADELAVFLGLNGA